MNPAISAHDRIIEAAANCIVEHGYAAVRMSTVAKAAGVSTALLHYHFETRENLFATVMRQCLGHLGINGLDEGDLHQLPVDLRLSTMIATCLPTNDRLRRDWILWYELFVQAVHDPELGRLARELYVEIDEWFTEAIQAGVDEGVFTPVIEPATIARMTLALCDGLGTRIVVDDLEVSISWAQQFVATEVGRLLGAELPEPASEVHRSFVANG